MRADRRVTRSWSDPRIGSLTVAVAVAAATAVAFLPILGNGFVTLDDVAMFLENPSYRGLGWAQVRWAFTTFHLGHYAPLTWLSYSVDYLIWGLDPRGYHLTSLVLHVAVALVLYGLTRRILALACPNAHRRHVMLAAGVAALVFGLNPLRVEAVAWATIRGTLLGGLFLLLATWAYVAGAVRSGDRPMGTRWLTGVVALFTLSLLCRTSGLTFPLVLVLLDVYPLNRLPAPGRRWLDRRWRGIWTEKLALVVVATAAVPVSFLARAAVSRPPGNVADLVAGVFQAAHGAVFYLGKTLVPMRLAPFYELPEPVNPLRWRFMLSGLVVLALTASLVALRRRWPGGLVAWATFWVLIAPMSGVLPGGNLPLGADRYTYVACVSWAMAAGGGVLALQTRSVAGRRRVSPRLMWCLIAGVLAWWGGLTWQRAGEWRDSLTFWSSAVRVTPESRVARTGFGAALERAGDLGPALRQFRAAAHLRPDVPAVWRDLGRVLLATGQTEAAVEAYRRGIELAPEKADGYVSLGVALAVKGQTDLAIEQNRHAVALEPGSWRAHYNLGLLLESVGRLDEAVSHLRAAAAVNGSAPEVGQALDATVKALEATRRR